MFASESFVLFVYFVGKKNIQLIRIFGPLNTRNDANIYRNQNLSIV